MPAAWRYVRVLPWLHDKQCSLTLGQSRTLTLNPSAYSRPGTNEYVHAGSAGPANTNTQNKTKRLTGSFLCDTKKITAKTQSVNKRRAAVVVMSTTQLAIPLLRGQ